MPEDASQTAESPRTLQPSALILFNRPEENAIPTFTLDEESLALLRSIMEHSGYACKSVNIDDDVDRIHDAVVVHQPTVIINLVEHMFGDTARAGSVMAMLDLFGYSYTGAPAATISMVQNRALMHVVLAEAGLPVTPYALVRDLNAIPDLAKVPMPHIVSQAFDDIYDEAEERPLLESAAETIRQCEELATDYDLPYLIEHYLPGQRVQACVIGDRVLEVLPLTECDPGGEVGEVRIAQLNADTAGRIRDLAQRAFRAAGLRDLGRIDFALSEKGEPFIVDTRAQVDLLGAIFRRAAEQSELGLEGALLRVVHLCHERLPASELELYPVRRHGD